MVRLDTVLLPVKMAIKAVRSILLLDEPLTIVDPGVSGEENLALLEKALASYGKKITDIKRIILTHGHVDHFGAASTIQALSGASIFLHPLDFEKVYDKKESLTRYSDLLVTYGMPQDLLFHLFDFVEYMKQFYVPLKEVQPIPTAFEFQNTSWQVIETPGHTRGSIVLYQPEEQILLSGDTVIKEISPNPIIEWDGENIFDSQAAFRSSLKKLSSFPYKRIIPAHGEEITDYFSVYENYQKNWAYRERLFLDWVKQKKETDAYEIALYFFQDKMTGFNIFLAMSEIIGYAVYFSSLEKIVLKQKNGKIKITLP